MCSVDEDDDDGFILFSQAEYVRGSQAIVVTPGPLAPSPGPGEIQQPVCCGIV